MKRQLIFIHSAGWRTGSTYMWNKFRQLSDVIAYYEPFNISLAVIKKEHINTWPIPSGHPENIDKPYFEEYRNFIRKEGGVEFFKKEFSHNNFFENAFPYYSWNHHIFRKPVFC